MAKNSEEVGRKLRKQLDTFKMNLSRKGVRNAADLQVYLEGLKPDERNRVAGLVPLVFRSPTTAAVRP
jgi:hypothetical protein